jgi:TatD-related deoxyribonuclease
MAGSTTQNFPLPIVDHHAHLRPGDRGLEAAAKFERLGGTHMFLATQNYTAKTPTTLEDYRSQFDTTIEIAKKVGEVTTVTVFPVIAPYPVDMVEGAKLHGLEAAEKLQCEALQLAGKYVAEKKAVALGEAGRAHFPIDVPMKEAMERVLLRAMEVARDAGCPIVLHTEEFNEATYRSMAQLAKKVGISPERVIKHYARAYLPPPSRYDLVPSFLAKRELVLKALEDKGMWFLETDYLDDPARPGKVLSLETIPRRVHWIAAMMDAATMVEKLSTPFVKAPKKIYGLDLARK